MNTLQLDQSLMIGKGRDRICFRHPDDPDFCIKVAQRSDEKQTRREKDYFLYLLKKGKDLRYIAPYMGSVRTSYGEGALFPMIQDDNGQVSPTLTEAIQSGLYDHDLVCRKLDTLKEYLIENGICARDVSPNNILCRRRGGQVDFILVDGVSNPNLNPLTIRMPALTRRALEKSWTSLRTKVARLMSEFNTTYMLQAP